MNAIQGEFPDRPFTYEEAADYLQVKPKTLRKWVSRKEIDYLKVGRRLVRFRRADLDAWLDKKLVAA